MTRRMAAALLALGLGGSPQAAGSDAAHQLHGQARAHLAAGRCHDAELTLRRLVRDHPTSEEALRAVRDLSRLGRLRRTGAALRVPRPEPLPSMQGIDAKILVDKGIPLAIVARSGAVTSDPELAVRLARALAREPDLRLGRPAAAAPGRQDTASQPPLERRVHRPADALLQRILDELETAECTLALGRATLRTRAPDRP